MSIFIVISSASHKSFINYQKQLKLNLNNLEQSNTTRQNAVSYEHNDRKAEQSRIEGNGIEQHLKAIAR